VPADLSRRRVAGPPLVVYDTNVIGQALAAALSKPPRRPMSALCLEAAAVGAVRLVTSRPMLDELLDVLQRPEAFDLPADIAREQVALVEGISRVVRPRPAPRRLRRDPDDQVVLDTATTVGAQFLVTKNMDDYTELARAPLPRVRGRGVLEFRWRGLTILQPEPYVRHLRDTGLLHL
jgi:predicted nucleic acid-binding protein